MVAAMALGLHNVFIEMSVHPTESVPPVLVLQFVGAFLQSPAVTLIVAAVGSPAWFAAR